MKQVLALRLGVGADLQRDLVHVAAFLQRPGLDVELEVDARLLAQGGEDLGGAGDLEGEVLGVLQVQHQRALGGSIRGLGQGGSVGHRDSLPVRMGGGG